MTDHRENRANRGASLLTPSGSEGDGARPGELQEAIDLLSARHRRARSRREAVENPWLNALSGSAHDPEAAQRLQKARLEREARLAPARPSLLQAAPREAAPQRKPLAAASPALPDPEPAPVERDIAPPQAGRPNGHVDAGHAGDFDGADRWTPIIDPVAVIRGVLSARKTIAATTLAGALLGVLIAISTPKHYLSTAEVLIDPRDIKIADRELTNGNLPSDATLAIIENQVRIMYSGPVLSKVVEKLRLDADPEFNGQAEGIGLGSLVGAVRGLFSSAGGPAREGRLKTLAIETLAENLTIERSGKTFSVTISAKSRDADKSAAIANGVFEAFKEEVGKIQSTTVGRVETDLTERLGQLRRGVQEAEQAVETFKTANDLIDAQGRLISDDQIVKINDQLSVARARTIELNAKVRSIREINADSAVSASLPEYVNSAVLSELRSQYARLKQEADSLANRLGPRHPKLQAAQAQLDGARNQIGSELQRIAASIQVELKRAVEQEQALAASLADAKAKQSFVSDKLVELRELERESAAQRAIYENYLLRARDAGEQKSVSTANIALISAATPPLLPTGVSRVLIVLAGTMLGFLAGMGIGALRGAISSFRNHESQMAGFSNIWRNAGGETDRPGGPSDDTPPPSGAPRKGVTAPALETAPEFPPFHQGQRIPEQAAAAPALAAMPAQPPHPHQQQVIAQPIMPQPFMPQPVMMPHPMMMPPVMQPMPQPWPVWPMMQQPFPAPAWPYPTPPVMPVPQAPAAPMAEVPQPAAPVAASAPRPMPGRNDNDQEIEELRESLRAVREKVLWLGNRHGRRNS